MIRSIAPGTEISDISHLIRPLGVREGALVLAESVPYFPKSVHLAVIDPGVGSDRRAVIVSAAEGSLLVGPDNGLLMPSAARLGGVEGAWEITNAQLGLPHRSSTFHGRDIFAPAAAHLAKGVSPERFGPKVAVESLVRLPAPAVRDLGACLSGEVVQVDRFGNLQTSFTLADLPDAMPLPGEVFELQVGGMAVQAAFRKSYAYGDPGELQLVEDSHGSLALCVNQGSAAGALEGVGPGATVLLGRPGFVVNG